MSVLNKIKKNTVVKDSIFEEKEPTFISTGCYALNILFSGKLNGGIQLGRISEIVAPPSLGKCSRGTEEIDIIISKEVYEKYFVQSLRHIILGIEKGRIRLTIEYGELFTALGLNDDVNESTVYDPKVDIFVVTPFGDTRINYLIKKPTQAWINVFFEGIEKPSQVSPNHRFFTTESTIFAKYSIGTKVVFRDRAREVIDITVGFQDEPLYDISINNTNAPGGFSEAYYLSNGSLNHNSFVGLKVAKNAQKQDMEVVYIDTEFAFDPHFAEKIGVDLDKMLVIQNNKIEDVLQVVASLPTDMSKEEKATILVIIDSWGGLVTSKTVADAIDGKDVSDMTIAKKKNSLARILNGIGTTAFVVNQTYQSMNMYDPLEIGGGKGLTFCASSIVMGTSKAKSKEGDEVNGAVITAVNKKGRLAIENSKLKYLIKFNGGIHPYYGILEDALEGEYVVKPNQGWYTRPCVPDDKKWREKELWEKSSEFWDVIINTTDFAQFIEKKYSFKHNYIISDTVMVLDEDI